MVSRVGRGGFPGVRGGGMKQAALEVLFFAALVAGLLGGLLRRK
jgi:hypothetical protein